MVASKECQPRHVMLEHAPACLRHVVEPAAQGEEQLELEVFGRGGHASMPPRHGSVRCTPLG